jgi:hypothetical protein
MEREASLPSKRSLLVGRDGNTKSYDDLVIEMTEKEVD